MAVNLNRGHVRLLRIIILLTLKEISRFTVVPSEVPAFPCTELTIGIMVFT